MALDIYQVDAFSAEPFQGNPAAVCPLPEARDATWMQNVALEMNLSETAFLVARDGGYDLRWFTPLVEVDLCGHATLASAHILWETRMLSPADTAVFHTRSGVLTAAKDADLIELDFPATMPEPAEVPPGLLDALGVSARFVGRSRFDYFVVVDDEDDVRSLSPDISALRRHDIRGVIVTAPASTEGIDVVSRFFAPGSGIDEDPVTGSAHCTIGPYWGRELGKETLSAYQASARGGHLRVRMRGDRVRLGGHAVTVMRGTLLDG